MKRVVFWASGFFVGASVMPTIGFGQAIEPITSIPIEQGNAVLPKNTPVYLRLNDTLSTNSKATKKGSTFTLSVSRAVVLNRHIVIPAGSRAIGTVIYRTRKGAFGKSGKIEVTFDYVDVGDSRIPIHGGEREEGEGNSTATVATAFFSIAGASWITGHSAEIRAGQEFTAWTKDDVPVWLTAEPTDQMAASGVIVAKPLPVRRAVVAEERSFGNARIQCVTCR